MKKNAPTVVRPSPFEEVNGGCLKVAATTLNVNSSKSLRKFSASNVQSVKKEIWLKKKEKEALFMPVIATLSANTLPKEDPEKTNAKSVANL